MSFDTGDQASCNLKPWMLFWAIIKVGTGIFELHEVFAL